MPLPLPEALLVLLTVGWVCFILVQELSADWQFGLHKVAAESGRVAPKPPTRGAPTWAALGTVQNIWAHLGQPRVARAPALPHVADLLIVDDSAVARAKLKALFVINGYSVHLAKDGLEALQRLRAGRYALMITDLEMPHMDGIALIRECLQRTHTARMPIIAVSAHENLRAKFNLCGDVRGVHRKPWSDDILLSHVATLVSAPGGGALHGPQHVQPAAQRIVQAHQSRAPAAAGWFAGWLTKPAAKKAPATTRAQKTSVKA